LALDLGFYAFSEQAMLHAYWDESGHSKDPHCRFVGMAGVVIRATALPRLESDWRQVLDRHDIPFFHSSDWGGRGIRTPGMNGAAEIWTSDQKQLALDELLKAITNAQPAIVGAVMDMTAWRALERWQQRVFVDPWTCCLQECVRRALACALTDPVEGEGLEMVFSNQEEFRDQGGRLWDSLKLRKQPGYERLGAFTMDEMRTCLPLQAADLVVYEFVKAAPSFLAGGQIRPAIPALLRADPNAFIMHIDAGELDEQLRVFDHMSPEARRGFVQDDLESID
jgi:hypothetical protein